MAKFPGTIKIDVEGIPEVVQKLEFLKEKMEKLVNAIEDAISEGDLGEVSEFNLKQALKHFRGAK